MPFAGDRGLRIVSILAVLLILGGGALILLVLGSDGRIHVTGPSMRPAIATPLDLEIDSGAYDDAAPAIGDIVAAQAPQGIRAELCGAGHPAKQACPLAEPDYSAVRVVKRIVAGPGDQVAFTADGHVIRNGTLETESYIRACGRKDCALPVPLRVPAGRYFLAGDNREISSDSRYWGPLPANAIDGRVTVP